MKYDRWCRSFVVAALGLVDKATGKQQIMARRSW